MSYMYEATEGIETEEGW